MVSIRPITLDDAEILHAVRSRNGLPDHLTPGEWRKWQLSFPYRQQFEDVPLGWIL